MSQLSIVIALSLLASWCLHAFKLGVENITQPLLGQLRTMRVGLVMNQTSINQEGKSTAQVFLEQNIVLKKLLVPEHGLHGRVVAGKEVQHGFEDALQIPVVSLYDGNNTNISQSVVHDIDVIIFDLQDVGMRHFTYISTLYRVLEAAALFNKKVVVLDRPNPLGQLIEGPLVQPHLLSFISIASIPLRHGMTIGELACYFNRYVLKKPANLVVVKMEHYERTMRIPLQAHLSPNIAHHHACYGYSFLGLLGEVRPFNVGIGTDLAFQCILLPESLNITQQQWQDVGRQLKKCNIRSEPHRHFCDRKKQLFKGLKIAIPDINKVASWEALLTILNFFKSAGVSLQFSPLFAKAVGTEKLSECIANNCSYNTLIEGIAAEQKNFLTKAHTVCFYAPLPCLGMD